MSVNCTCNLSNNQTYIYTCFNSSYCYNFIYNGQQTCQCFTCGLQTQFTCPNPNQCTSLLGVWMCKSYSQIFQTYIAIVQNIFFSLMGGVFILIVIGFFIKYRKKLTLLSIKKYFTSSTNIIQMLHLSFHLLSFYFAYGKLYLYSNATYYDYQFVSIALITGSILLKIFLVIKIKKIKQLLKAIMSFHFGFLLTLFQVFFFQLSLILVYQGFLQNNYVVPSSVFWVQNQKYILYLLFVVLRNINITFVFHQEITNYLQLFVYTWSQLIQLVLIVFLTIDALYFYDQTIQNNDIAKDFVLLAIATSIAISILVLDLIYRIYQKLKQQQKQKQFQKLQLTNNYHDKFNNQSTPIKSKQRQITLQLVQNKYNNLQ